MLIVPTQDKTLICKDCSAEFVFPVRDQEFYDEKGFVEPKRCKPCRDKKKARNEERGQ